MKKEKIILQILIAGLLLLQTIHSTGQKNEEDKQSKQQNLKSIQINGTSLHYIDTGKGSTVIFVHGSLGDYRTWSGQIPVFAKSYRVISYSRRYAYPNNDISDSLGYSVLPHAKDLAAFIKALGVGPVHLVGHSYGAYVALLTAIDHPELVRTLTLGEPPIPSLIMNDPEGDSILNQLFSKGFAPSDQAFKSGDKEKAIRIFLASVIGDENFYDKLPPEAHQIMMQNIAELKGSTATGEQLFPPTTCEEIKKVNAPTLLLVGDRSPRFFTLIADKLESCFKTAERIVISNSSHGLELENPDAFNKTVLMFIGNH